MVAEHLYILYTGLVIFLLLYKLSFYYANRFSDFPLSHRMAILDHEHTIRAILNRWGRRFINASNFIWLEVAIGRQRLFCILKVISMRARSIKGLAASLVFKSCRKLWTVELGSSANHQEELDSIWTRGSGRLRGMN